jgi:hypothetical protein
VNVPIVFRGPNGAAAGVAAQHSQCFGAWYSHCPGLKVWPPNIYLHIRIFHYKHFSCLFECFRKLKKVIFFRTWYINIIWTQIIFRSQDSSVGIAMGYGLDSRGSIPGRCKIFFFSTVSTLALGPTQPPIQWVPGVLSLGVKRLGREADHSPPSSAEVKNCGAVPPLPHISSWNSA